MPDIDALSVQLLEQAKRFLEKAKIDATQDGQAAYSHAALLLGFCSLEAHINAVAEELTIRPKLQILDQSILTEKEVLLVKGTFRLTDKLKMYRLEERLGYILANFTKGEPLSKQSWWGNLSAGLAIRNSLVHAKGGITIHVKAVSRSLQAIIDCLDTLYVGVYRRRYPGHSRGLDSSLHF